MLIFGVYLIITSIIEYKKTRNYQRKESDNEKSDVDSTLSNYRKFPLLKYMISQFLMEIGDKCQIGAITMSIAYNV